MSETRSDSIPRLLIAIGALLGMLAVIGGTFAAHVLDKNLDPKMLNTFEVAVRYHMYHALAICIVAWIYDRWPGRLPLMSAGMFVIGALLFSGGLYLYVVTEAKWLVMLAPLGGSAFIVGWLMLALAVVIPSSKKQA